MWFYTPSASFKHFRYYWYPPATFNDINTLLKSKPPGLFIILLTLKLTIIEKRQLSDDLLNSITTSNSNQGLNNEKKEQFVKINTTMNNRWNYAGLNRNIIVHMEFSVLHTLQARARIESASVIGVLIDSNLRSTWNVNVENCYLRPMFSSDLDPRNDLLPSPFFSFFSSHIPNQDN